MTDKSQIPFLVKLLDDSSEEIQQTVIKELASFGPNLKGEIEQLDFILSPVQRTHIRSIFDHQKRLWLRQNWPKWFDINDDNQRLEKAVIILSHFLQQDRPTSIKHQLDHIAKTYRSTYSVIDEKKLAFFLFKQLKFKGNEKDYYNPQNSNLSYVIQHKRGIPISLAIMYKLVGSRLGLDIHGCHFPGHFLARIGANQKTFFVDCFNEGQIIREQDLLKVKRDGLENLQDVIHEQSTPESIIRRVLANLIHSFQVHENEVDSKLMVSLFKELEKRSSREDFSSITPTQIISDSEPLFDVGEIIAHAKYGYRGIIVDIDYRCCATDQWYYSNDSQPDRNQPWYHVLVDGTDQVTYVAEDNLIENEDEAEIKHPLLNYFFDTSDEGDYMRNDNPWPETNF